MSKSLYEEIKELIKRTKSLIGSRGQASGIATLGLDGKVPSAQLPASSGTGFSGSYTDLTNKPTIPTNANYVDLSTNQDVGGFKNFTSPISSNRAVFTVGNPGDTPIVLKTAVNQTAPFMDFRNSDGNPICFIHHDGRFEIPYLSLFGIGDFADNAAALAGGLNPGAVYKSGDFLKIVH